MSTEQVEGEDVYLRDDLHNLSLGMQASNFNVRKYKNSHQTKGKRKTLPTNHSLFTENNRNQTEPIEDVKPAENGYSKTHAMERFIKKGESKKKINNFTGSLKHSAVNYKRSLTKNATNECLSAEDIRKNSYASMEKKYNKGKLSIKVIQSWLNNIILESLQLEILDKSLGNAALKKFQIDQNTLMSRGLKGDDIERIYRSLFVYSLGYNNFLRQTVRSDITFKNIWKVYSVLLQYCAQGKYETLIGTLQRQKSTQAAEMQLELSKKQEVIEKNEELNEEKNIQIFKEIRYLKEENINLTNEKDILYEDFQKTDQAFNEEVSLRLKFENRINELFGIHRQLALKHERLYDDYKKKVIEWNVSNNKYNVLILEYKNTKNELQSVKTNLDQQRKKNKYNSEHIDALKEEKMLMKNELTKAKHNYEQEKRLVKEYLRRISQFEIQQRNNAQLLKIKDKSWEETHSQYKLSLQQNNRLYNTINEQRLHVQQLLYNKKEFNNTILSLMADSSFHKNKAKQYENLYIKQENELKKIMDINERHELKIKVLEEQKQSFQNDLKENYINIKKMHDKNNELAQELSYLREFQKELGPVMEGRQKQVQKYMKYSEELQKQKQKLTQYLKRSELKFKVYKAQIQPQLEHYKHKVERMKKERGELQDEDSLKNNKMLALELQIDKLKESLRNSILNYKNEKFQRFNLKENYDSMIVVLEKKNKIEKDSSIQISELKDKLNNTKNQLSKKILKYDSLLEKHETMMKTSSQKIDELEEKITKRGSYVHPFVFEDTAENYRRKCEKQIEDRNMIKKLKGQMNQKINHYEGKIKAITNSNDEFVKQMKDQYERRKFSLQTQVEYEKQKNKRLQGKLKMLEQLKETYYKKIEERTTSEREKIYADLIQQKSKVIEEMQNKLNIEVKKNSDMKEEMVKKKEQFEDNMFDKENEHKKQINRFEEKFITASYEVEYMRSKIVQFQKESQQQQILFEHKLNEKLKEYQIKNPPLKSEDIKNRTKAKWERMEKLERENPKIQKRNEIANRIQFASTYYNQN